MLKSLVRPLYRLLRPEQHPEPMYQVLQRQIVNQYKLARLNGQNPYKNISEAGFRCYSQFEEDGIILFILSMIGFKTKKVVELCCGAGDECMATNLILNHGFDGFLFDGDEKSIAAAKAFFNKKKDCMLYPPHLQKAWITIENVNQILKDAGASGEVDLFSLDIDGNDYWIWDAIEEIQPRLCVFETHNIIPENLSLTMKYQPDFDCWSQPADKQDYRSASFAAMVKLSKKKGYRLIGGHRHGFNVFFLRNDIELDLFPEVSIEDVHNNFWTKNGQKNRWPIVKDMDWVEV